MPNSVITKDEFNRIARHARTEMLFKRTATSPLSPQIYRQGLFEPFALMPLRIVWNLTLMCNYKCSYCFGQEPLDKRRFTSIELLYKAVNHLVASNRPCYRFVFTGGEPTVHPEFYNLLCYIEEKLNDRLDDVIIISNGSRQNDFYEKLDELSGKMNINFFISLHTEFVDLEHIVDMIGKLAYKSSLCFNLMFNPAKGEYTKEIFTRLCQLRADYPFYLNIELLRGGRNFDIIDPRYKEADFQWHAQAVEKFNNIAQHSGPAAKWFQRFDKKHFWDYIRDGIRHIEFWNEENRPKKLKEGFFNFMGLNCCSGTTVIYVSPDGDVQSALCNFSPAKYNIFNENPFDHDDFMKILKCPARNCGCGANDFLPKFASTIEAEAFIDLFRQKQKELMAGD